MKNKKVLIINLLLLAIVFLLGFMVRNSGEGILFDEAILDFLHKDKSPFVFSFMKFISFIGSEKFLFPVVGIAIIVSLIKKKYFVSKILLFNTLGSYLLNHGLKILFNRTRPFEFMLVNQSGLSYPSGHSMVTISMYLTLAFLLSSSYLKKCKKEYLYLLALLITITMGISRLYLGVHWPTDIIGGYLSGYLLYYVSTKIFKAK